MKDRLLTIPFSTEYLSVQLIYALGFSWQYYIFYHNLRCFSLRLHWLKSDQAWLCSRQITIGSGVSQTLIRYHPCTRQRLAYLTLVEHECCYLLLMSLLLKFRWIFKLVRGFPLTLTCELYHEALSYLSFLLSSLEVLIKERISESVFPLISARDGHCIYHLLNIV